jgi:hypothetical protein
VADVLKEPDVPGQVEEPLVPREAHARSREVPHHLGSVRGGARNRAGDRSARRPRLERCFTTKARTATARPKTVKAAPRVQAAAPAARRARAS